MARATKPPVRDAWARDAVGSPDIEEAVYVDTGFPAPGGTPVVPLRGNVNHEFNRYDTGLIYLMQRGIADWDTNETDYDDGDIVRYLGKFYVATGTPAGGVNPVANPAYWWPWLASPVATASAWASRIWSYYNARKITRFAIDHGGFDAGQITGFDESWDQMPTIGLSGPDFKGRWEITGTTGAGAQPLQAGSSLFLGAAQMFAMMDISGTAGVAGEQIIFKHKFHPAQAKDDIQIALSFPVAVGVLADLNAIVGLTDGSAFPSPQSGVYFAKGATNWQAVTVRDGSATSTDTGIAVTVNVFYRMRIDLYGGGASDDTIARALFFIDGALVANHTANLPMGGTDLDLMTTFGLYNTGTHGSPPHLYVGPVKYRQNMWAGDVGF